HPESHILIRGHRAPGEYLARRSQPVNLDRVLGDDGFDLGLAVSLENPQPATGHPVRLGPQRPGQRDLALVLAQIVLMRPGMGGADIGRALRLVGEQCRPAHQAAFRAISPRSTSVSAIWTALSAAPLRRLSETIHMASPFSTVRSSRMRETKVASSPLASTGVA